MPTPIYSLQNASLSFAKQQIFQELELYLYPGDKICLIGKNGSGKTSILKIITGEYELDDGKIYQQPQITIAHLEQDTTITE